MSIFRSLSAQLHLYISAGGNVPGWVYSNENVSGQIFKNKFCFRVSYVCTVFKSMVKLDGPYNFILENLAGKSIIYV